MILCRICIRCIKLKMRKEVNILVSFSIYAVYLLAC